MVLKKLLVSWSLCVACACAFAGSYEDFFKAIALDDDNTVQALLQRGFDPNTVNPEGVSALMLAVKGPSLKVAQLLAAWPQVKIESRNEKDESVLMLASLKGYLPLVKTLVARDADVNKPGWTALHYAASNGHVAVIEFLLDHSAYIDAESPNGTTPLMMAAMYGSPESVKVLIQAGADLQIKNQLGMTALDFAVRGDRQNAKELIETGLQRLASRTVTTETVSSEPVVGNLPKPAPVLTVEPSANTPMSKPLSPPSRSGW